MKHTTLPILTASTIAASAFATVSSTLVADTYVVKDGNRFYSVLDVYAKGNHVGDVMAGVFGTTDQQLVVATNRAQGVTRDANGRVTSGNITSDIFAQAGGSSWSPSYAGTSGSRWDSFMANGNRTQGASVTNRAGQQKNLGDASNWSAMNNDGSASHIANTISNAWYTFLGSNPYSSAGLSENPFARMSLYNASWNSTYADLDRSRLASNGALRNGVTSAADAWANRLNPLAGPIAGGASLDFHWMIGRFAVETTGLTNAYEITLNVQFTMIGRNGTSNEAGTLFSGANDPNYRVSQFFAFAVPAPGAIGLIWPLLVASRRRRTA